MSEAKERLMVAGRALLRALESGGEDAEQAKKMLDNFLFEKFDRELFELEPKEGSTQDKARRLQGLTFEEQCRVLRNMSDDGVLHWNTQPSDRSDEERRLPKLFG